MFSGVEKGWIRNEWVNWRIIMHQGISKVPFTFCERIIFHGI